MGDQEVRIMSIKWIKTAHKGLRYYEHPTRKHGKRKDRYYTIRFKVDKKEYTYGIGWVSDGVPEEVLRSNPGVGFEEYCLMQLRIFKTNVRSASGARSPRERREIIKEEMEREEKENLPFNVIYTEKYLPVSEQNKKNIATEEGLFKHWLSPVIGNLALKDISPIHLERIKKNMADAGRSPRTINYALSVIRQLYNFSKNIGLYSGECPVKKVKIPREDNRRLRFLTHEEAEAILTALKEKSQDVYDMTLLSLHCGLRAGEVFSLTWADVDVKKGILTLRNTKSGRTRHNYMTEDVKAMLSSRTQGKGSDLVFPTAKNKQRVWVSNTFAKVVDALNLNEGVTDRRQKVVWHTLRHTYASWLVQAGVSLYHVQKLMGHEEIRQTERYSHLNLSTLQDAVKTFESTLKTDENKQRKSIVKEI
jgi:integrase